MSKGLEILEKYKRGFVSKEYEIIEKELIQAEENEKLLNVFKNALTIEHHDISMVDPHNDSEDIVSYAFKTLDTVRQNELDKSMRKALREWVLKNAFPKELKALDIIKNKNVIVVLLKESSTCEQYNNAINFFFNHCKELTQEEYDLLKEVLL